MVADSEEEIKCPKCGHVWTPRVEQPKRCPRCGRWLVPAGEEEEERKTSDIKRVQKRDGRIVDFDQSKITNAIWSAAQAIGGRDKRLAKRLSDKVVDYLEKNIEKEVPHVEEIQDAVEKVLIENGHAKTAKAYILYRKQHEDMRKIKSTFLEVEELVDDYLGQKSWRVKENSNVGYSMSGLYKHAAGSVVSNYTLDRIYPIEVSDAHRNGDIHIHDLSFGIAGYCFDEKTRILTEDGLKYFDELNGKEKVATLNPDTKELVFQKPEKYQVYEFEGDLLRFSTDTINLLVTPEHRLLHMTNGGSIEKIAAKEVGKRSVIRSPKAVCSWNGKNGEIDLEKVENIGGGPVVNLPDTSVEKLAEFIGWYIAEGNVDTDGGGYRISISQVNKSSQQEVAGVMKDIGLNPSISEYHVTSHSKQLYNFLKSLGVSNEKFIPKEFKNASTETIENMLNALFKGDGTFDEEGRFKEFYSNSKKLVEDVAECLIKTGRWASIRKRRDEYELTVSRSEKFWYEDAPDKEKYEGKVYDVTVPNGTVLVERGGKFMWSSNCAGWSLSKLLKEGFNGVPGRVESKPPKHYDTALLQMANFIGTLQNEWAGAQAFNSMDTLLAPFVRKDDLSYKEVKQGMQKFVFNLNIASRWGGQTPFTNLTLDWNVPEDLKDQPVIYAGETMDETYEDYQEEMDLINKAFLEVMMEGDMKGRPFTFPIPTYNVTDEFNWDSENAELLFQMTAQYGLPYFSNFVSSPNLDPSDIRSMCPIGGDEKVLIKSSRGRNLEYSKIRNIFEGNSKQEKYEIFSDGKFVKGRFAKYPNQEMIEVTLENNHSIKMTKKHLNFVMSERDGKIKELKGEELEEGMYLPYSLREYEGRGGNWNLGYFVGAYAGDGSIDNGTVVFSLNKNQKDVAENLASIAEKYFGAHSSTSEEKELLSLRIHSKAAVGLCKDYVSGKGREKHYRARVFDSSKEFREGVIQGHYDTDGGDRNRIYTSSEKMVESLNMIAATLGTTTSIYTDDREERFGEESNYAVLVYQLNREAYGEFWFKHDEKLWIKIKSIEDISDNTAYCFEVENGEPMFTVGTTGILTHNCHLRLDKRELERNVTGGLFGSGDMTGSLGVVTVNMPRLGYLSGSKEDFFERLDHMMVLAKNSLEIKRNVVRKNMENELLPFSKRYLGTLRNHFSTIGLVGMNEACLNLLGENITTKEGHDFSVEVLEYMRGRLQDFQEKTGNIYNLEATPAEGTSYRLAKIDKKKYPDIVAVGKDTPYYTNSTQVPVGETDDVFEQIEVEEDLQTLYTGGTVFHTFLGERMTAEEARTLVRKLTSESKLPYITLTPTYSICQDHGYINGEHAECPECGENTEVYSRVVGYYRPVQNWNDGKQEEFAERKTFDKERALARA